MRFYASQFDSWEEIVACVQSKPELRDYLFLGVDRHGELKFLHRDLARANAQFVGRTRSGKTALAALPLAIQEIRRKETGVWFFDPKGSDADFHTLAKESRDAGLEFKYLTVESDRATYGYFPLKQSCWKRMTPPEQTQELVHATGTDHGEVDPGLAYFGGTNVQLFSGVLKSCPSNQTFRKLHDATKGPGAYKRLGMLRRDFENAGAAVSILAQLADCPQMNEGAPRVEAAGLDVERLLGMPHVTYLRAPVTRMPPLSRAFFRFLATQIVSTARGRGGAPVQQILIFDEFQTLAHRVFVEIIKQCVDLRISCWMAHQNFADLEQGVTSMLDQVSGNVAVRVMFSADALGKKHLQEHGGERIRVTKGHSRTISESSDGSVNVAWSSSVQEVIDKQISDDDVLALNLTGRLGTVEAYPAKGLSSFSGPTFLQFLHICSPEEYQRRKTLPWPAPTEETMLGSDAWKSVCVAEQQDAVTAALAPPSTTSLPVAPPVGKKPKRKPQSPVADSSALQQLLWHAARSGD